MNGTVYSPYLDLDDAVRSAGGKVPLAWVRSRPSHPGNFGDTASAIAVAAISGRTPAAKNFNDPTSRLTAVGTIGQNMRLGTVHMWGTGVDAGLRAFGNRHAGFAAAPNTTYVIHASRGPHSRRSLLEAGLHAPPIYGDGCWFLPRIMQPQIEKKYELGVVLHLSELETPTVQAGSKHTRYLGGEPDGVRLISTLHEPTLAAFSDKLAEMLSCRRIVSTSFHGMMVADAYGIPCLYFPPHLNGPAMLETEAGPKVLDHRFADFYSGGDRVRLPSYGQPLSSLTAWDRVIRAADQLWTPMTCRGAETFFNAFPLNPRVSFADAAWPLDAALFNGVPM